MLKMENSLHVEHCTTARLLPARLIWKVSCFSVAVQPLQKLGFLIVHQWQQMVYLYAHAEAKTQGDLNGTKIDICCADKVLPIPCPKVQRESIVYIINCQ